MGLTPFQRLCNLLEDESLEERTDRPVKDALQDGWVRTMETYNKQGKEIKNATTRSELEEAYEGDAGLIVQAFQHSYEDIQRKLRGHSTMSPRKTQLLRDMFSLDTVNADGVLNAEMIEDLTAQVAFEEVEASDILQHDPRYQGLDITQKEAVRRFTIAWLLQESGLPVPNKVRKQIGRDRVKTGLALELKLGRK